MTLRNAHEPDKQKASAFPCLLKDIPLIRSRAFIMTVAGVLLLAAVTLAACLLFPHQSRDSSQDRQYASTGRDEGSQFRYSPETLGEYEVVASHLSEDGAYYECLRSGVVQLRLWRAPAREGVNCQSLATENFPSLTGWHSVRLDRELRDVFDQRGAFSAENAEGETQTHTVLWVTRGGWDYLVDFAVPEQESAAQSAFIEKVIGGIYFI